MFEAGVLRRMMGVVCNKVTRCLENWASNKGKHEENIRFNDIFIENEVDQAIGAIGSVCKFLRIYSYFSA